MLYFILMDNLLSTSIESLTKRVLSSVNEPENRLDNDSQINCQICNSNKMHKFLSLGHHPNPDGFLTEEKLKESETFYPLEVYFCENCKLVQLGHTVDPNDLFTENFIYTTGSNKGLVRDFHALVEILVKRFDLGEGDLAIDIGGNDGTLLKNYLPYGINILNIDPSKAARLSTEKGIPTKPDFFNEETAIKTKSEFGKAKIITATNVFAHVDKLDSFMRGIQILLDDKGIFVEESGYIKDLISEREYDSIYLEHLRYYSLKPLITLFNKFDMDVFDAEKISTHGGSLRVFACKKGAFPISENIFKILKEEENFGLYSKEIFDSFGEKVISNRNNLRNILFELKKQNKKIMGLGAPAKGNTLLNFCKIGDETIDCLLESGSLKIGTYSPGMHLKVLDEEILFSENAPDYLLLLIWNIKDIIIPKLRSKGFKGGFIVPVPEPHIISYGL